MSRIDTWRRRAAHLGPAEGHGPWRVGWSGPGWAAGVTFAGTWGVAADRTGPDRVGSRAWRSGAAARAALARGRWPTSGWAWHQAMAPCVRVRGLEDPSAHSLGSAPVCRSARASPPRPSTRPRIVDGLGHQLVMFGPDGQPAADLLEDLGGIPPCPGRIVQPAGEAVRAGLGQVGGQAVRAAVDDGLDDVHG